MGKNLIQQRRGKGTIRFRAPSFKYKGQVGYSTYTKESMIGEIKDITHCRGHSAPLMMVEYKENKEKCSSVLLQAPEGVRAGDRIMNGEKVPISLGNVLPLKSIPEGTTVYNIESSPGDGGKFCRAGGAFAKVLTKMENKIILLLPSKKEREFRPECRATIGIISGGGRKEKPFLKAGFKYHAMKARNKWYPKVSGTAMNAVAHPFGGSSTCSKGNVTTISRDAPPGKKVGKISARRTGKKK